MAHLCWTTSQGHIPNPGSLSPLGQWRPSEVLKSPVAECGEGQFLGAEAGHCALIGCSHPAPLLFSWVAAAASELCVVPRSQVPKIRCG